MSTLEVRVNAQAVEDGTVGGAQLAGNIYSVEGVARSRRDVVLPIGEHVTPATFVVDPGRYVVEAALPSGRLLSHEVVVAEGQTVPVEFDATDSPSADLSWQYIVGNVESADIYTAETAVPVPRSRGAQTTLPGLVADQVAGALALPGVWCTGDADQGIGFAELLEVAEGQAERVFDSFTSASWVDKHEDIEPVAGDDGLVLFRFNSNTFPGLSAYATGGRRFLLVTSIVGRFVVTVPVPWMDVRSATEVTVEVLVNGRQSPFGNPVAVAVPDPTLGAGLGYLANGALARAATVFGDVEGMLFDKMLNPLGAAAGGYVLVGTDTAQQRTYWDEWIDNLDSRFPSMSDGAILRAIRKLRMAQSAEDLNAARDALIRAFRRGVPIFTLGLSWLIDGLSEFPDDECRAALKQVRRLSWRVDMREPFVIIRTGPTK
ncbi:MULTISPECIES: hypothetical protein [unclassified Mycobacterium]|uniref:hypothetical protein n=1 Tax=unclassified Mycobacterium TaxID=2642494 RepID=UPI0029C78461|nr:MULTISPECIES: hypothetical protein [unclassified Mycobacterium]